MIGCLVAVVVVVVAVVVILSSSAPMRNQIDQSPEEEDPLFPVSQQPDQLEPHQQLQEGLFLRSCLLFTIRAESTPNNGPFLKILTYLRSQVGLFVNDADLVAARKSFESQELA